MEKVEITSYKKEDFAELRKFVAEAFHPKYILTDQKFFDWQYENFYLAKIDGQIIGFFGFRDLLYKIYNESKPVRVLMNTFVSEKHRILGAGALLAEKVYQTANPILVSGYTPLLNKLTLHFRAKWRELGNLSRHLAVFNPRAAIFPGYRIPDTHRIDGGQNGNLVIKEADSADSRWEKFWFEVRHRYPVTIERTADYLNWRFFQHPFFRYSVLAATKGERFLGYLVWRMEESEGSFKIARIIDWVSLEEAEKPLLAAFVNSARTHNADAADFMFSGPFYKTALSALGFFDAEGTDFAKFPSRFNPLSHKKNFVNIATDISAPLGECYFTKAEGDQDRPNPH